MTSGNRPISGLPKLAAQVRWCARFYGTLFHHRNGARVGEAIVRAAPGYTPEFVEELVRISREDNNPAVHVVNFRSRIVTLGEPARRYFVKEFTRYHPLHDVERVLRCSRADRVWAAALLLPQLGFPTPPPVGTVVLPNPGRGTTDYCVTEMVEGALPVHHRMLPLEGEARLSLLRDYLLQMRRWHDTSVYLRDLLPNVLTTETPEGIHFYLTDLDQLHPYRRITRKRLLHHFQHLAKWFGPLSEEEQTFILETFAGTTEGSLARDLLRVLLATPPARKPWAKQPNMRR
jgi:hypothetical protein